MFHKMAFVTVAAALVTGIVAGCAGNTGKDEGESCQSADDCAGQLVCQPILGRQGDFCCPTPATNSDKDSCHPTTSTPSGGTPQ